MPVVDADLVQRSANDNDSMTSLLKADHPRYNNTPLERARFSVPIWKVVGIAVALVSSLPLRTAADSMLLYKRTSPGRPHVAILFRYQHWFNHPLSPPVFRSLLYCRI